jgi:hypothetical protein
VVERSIKEKIYEKRATLNLDELLSDNFGSLVCTMEVMQASISIIQN